MGGGKGYTVRYSSGWKAPEDRKAVTRVARAKKQNFQEIRQSCLAQGGLFEDPEFPANNRSVYYSVESYFEWKRPHEIVQAPHMFVGGASRFDVKQGELGNCWFLAAVASMCASRNTDLLYKVVPRDNSLNNNYAGVVHFQIWQYGQWVDVVIDDRLPTRNGRLVFMHSADQTEFWSALLEKAYAKLNGSYEALQGGCSSEAMEDFTGGICETFNLRKDPPKNLFSIVKKAYDRDSLIGCTIDAAGMAIEDVLPNGLVVGHAYSVTGAARIGDTKLIRVRNPWGNQHEWKGAWSDGSAEWNRVGAGKKQELGVSADEDGEFWMSFEDFMVNYHRLEICQLSPEFESEDSGMKFKRRWEASNQDGSWIKRVNAGGCRNFLDTFWTNPQYKVEVVDPDDEDDDDKGTLIVGVLQKERRKKKREGLDLLTIGYFVYKLPDANCGPLDLNYFKYNAAVARSPSFSNMREICGRHKVPVGHYCIIPCTFNPHEEGDFLLRIFSEKPNPSGEMDEPTTMISEDEDSHLGILMNPTSAQQQTSPQDLARQMEAAHQQQQQRQADDLARQMAAAQQKQADEMARKMQAAEQQQADEMARQMAAAQAQLNQGGNIQFSSSNNAIRLHISGQAEVQRRRRRARAVTQEDVDEEKKIRHVFKVKGGADLEVDAYELREILDENFRAEMKLRPRFKFDGFSLETCRSLVAMMDGDHSGKLGYEEFKKLWNDMRTWKKIFKEFDQDQSGTMNSFELRQALNTTGFRVSNQTFTCLVMRYSGPQGFIYFDDFILCVARLKTMFDTYGQTSGGNFSMDQFIQTTMYS